MRFFQNRNDNQHLKGVVYKINFLWTIHLTYSSSLLSSSCYSLTTLLIKLTSSLLKLMLFLAVSSLLTDFHFQAARHLFPLAYYQFI